MIEHEDSISYRRRLKFLRRLGVNSRILILTSSKEDHLVQETLAGGADRHILKTTRSNELIDAILDVAQGKGALDPVAVRAVMRQSSREDPLLLLSDREREVFELLARGKNVPEIAESRTVSEATVRTHNSNVLDKLGMRDRVQVMAFALKRGIVQSDDLI